jgi:hypothetical protein
MSKALLWLVSPMPAFDSYGPASGPGRVLSLDVNLQKSGWGFHLFQPGEDISSAADPTIELCIYVSSSWIVCMFAFEDVNTLETCNMTVFRVQDPTSFKGQIEALGDHARIAILVGGTPLPEKRHVYWNFVSMNK